MRTRATPVAVEVLVSARVATALRLSPYGLPTRAVRKLLLAWGPPLRPWFVPHGVVLPRLRRLEARDLERGPELGALAALRAELQPVLVEVDFPVAVRLAKVCRRAHADFVLSVAEALEHACVRAHASAQRLGKLDRL